MSDQQGESVPASNSALLAELTNVILKLSPEDRWTVLEPLLGHEKLPLSNPWDRDSDPNRTIYSIGVREVGRELFELVENQGLGIFASEQLGSVTSEQRLEMFEKEDELRNLTKNLNAAGDRLTKIWEYERFLKKLANFLGVQLPRDRWGYDTVPDLDQVETELSKRLLAVPAGAPDLDGELADLLRRIERR